MKMDECTCGSGQKKRALNDARGIFCAYVCDRCEDRKRGEYRREVFDNPNYWADEPIEDED